MIKQRTYWSPDLITLQVGLSGSLDGQEQYFISQYIQGSRKNRIRIEATRTKATGLISSFVIVIHVFILELDRLILPPNPGL
jgi:hypothetical protein